LLTQENNVPKEDKDNFEITELTNRFLEEVEEKIEEKNGIYSVEDQNKRRLEDMNNSNSENLFVKPMENPNLFQGDEVLTEEQAENIIKKVAEEAKAYEVDLSNFFSDSEITRKKRKIEVKKDAKWEFPIRYYVQGVNETLVDKSLKLIENETCIRFVKVYGPTYKQPGLKYFSGNGCWSFVGRKSPDQFQDISIGNGCTSVGTVQHETMHALGSTHEQCRADRDEFLTIYKDNFRYGTDKNFVKLDISNAITYNIKYDYGSDMHYALDSFTKNGRPTMLPNNRLFAKTIGTNSGLSFLDVKLLNLYYCSQNFTKIRCYNGGYPDPNNKTKCKCVEGYAGDNCIQLPKPNDGCNTTFYHATKDARNITLNGEKDCLYHLKAPHGMKINITIVHSMFDYSSEYTCMKGNSLEIKFISDKTPTGALFCSENRNVSIISEKDHAIVHYRTPFWSSKMNVIFHAI
uniref:Zinc metalloproteinase n=1 Tax=Strongyloides papillosus TaxID=174720 RepID=A0A0N5B6X7_STREA